MSQNKQNLNDAPMAGLILSPAIQGVLSSLLRAIVEREDPCLLPTCPPVLTHHVGRDELNDAAERPPYSSTCIQVPRPSIILTSLDQALRVVLSAAVQGTFSFPSMTKTSLSPSSAVCQLELSRSRHH